MNTQHNLRVDTITDEDIADFLRENPEFFEEHQELLGELKVPHLSGGAVSLIERQVDILREQNNDLRRKMVELVEAARDNASTHERVQRLTLALLETKNFDDVLYVTSDLMRNEFQADLSAFWLHELPEGQEGNGDIHLLDRQAPGFEAFTRFFHDQRPLCGRLRSEQLAFLFGENAEAVGSAVLIPLGEAEPLGMLAIGSYQEDRFHPGMGTAVLRQLGELLTRALITRRG